MKKKLLLAFFFLTLSLTYSQIKYEPGYIIEHNGKKTDVLILNVDWKSNPTSINYKKNENSEIEKATTKEIKEFEVGEYRYEAATVDVDKSSHITRDLSTDRNPILQEETLFLRYLIDGAANLYILEGNNILYFYNKKGDPIQPLISKKYNVNGKIRQNNQFRQQLYSNLQCDGMDLINVNNVTYRKDSLIKYFVDFNTCVDEDFVYEKQKRKGEFNLSLKAGAGLANIEVEGGMNAGGIEMNGPEYRAGVELEYVFPFYRNKWAAYFEPTYRTFKDEQSLTRLYLSDLSVRYTSVELGLGARHYLFLNEESKLFLNLKYVYDYHVNSEILFSNTTRNMDPVLSNLVNSSNLNLGFGYVLKNKFLVEATYIINRPFRGRNFVFENYLLNWRSQYSAITLMVGYRLF